MRGALFLGLDVGTQGTKGVLVDADAGAIVGRAGRSYGRIEGLPEGAAEQHPQTWIEAVAEVARELLAGVEPARLGGLGVSGQQHGLVLLDGEDRVVRPAKLWCDTATAAEADELSQQLGRRVPTGFTAPKVLWLARREPESWARTARALLPHDYVNLRLTGRFVTEAGDASGTGYFDVRERRYDAAALELLQLEGRVPPVLEAGEPAGELTDEGAGLLGLARGGTLVAAGGGDNMLSAIGSGATRPGVAVCSLGTSGTLFAHAAAPVVDPDGRIAAFCDSTGGWLPLLCVMNATGVADEICALTGASHAELTREAACVPAGSGGLLLVPYLVGERVPDLPQASGLLAGIRPGSLRRGSLYRAALEGVALNLAWGAARMRALGLELDSVRLVGGGAQNPLWREVLADALEAPVEVLAEAESAALGAALQALWTARRSSGESCSADEVAAPFVRTTGAGAEPDPLRSEALREARARLEQLAARAF